MSGFFSSSDSGTSTSTSTSSSSARKSVLSAGGLGADQPAGEVLNSEHDRVSAIQRQLQQETLFRGRGYGLRSLLGPLGSGRTSLLGVG